MDEPEDYDIRAEIMWACKLAQDTTPGFGRKQDWACHKIAHEISGFYDAAHGAVMGAVYFAWLQWVYPRNMAKLSQLGERVFGAGNGYGPSESALMAIRRFKEFLIALKMPTSLRELGIQDRSAFSELASNAVEFQQSGTVGNYVRLSPQDICELLTSALG
jgi:hypothetical protein